MKRFLKKLGIWGISYNIAIFLKFYILKNYKIYKKVDKSNPKTFPIIIISFNQFFYLKQLIEFLQKHHYSNLIIIDNASTYKPLIKFFTEIESTVTIHRLKKNHGHMVFWKKKEFFKLYGQNYYAITDPDVVPEKNCPDDFLLHFKNILDDTQNITKVGFSLKIDDIPKHNPYRENIINWEKKFWQKKNTEGNYFAEIDTTFALYRPKKYPVDKKFFRAIRTGKPYIAKHGGWYLNPLNLSKEQEYYMKTSNNSSSWKLDEKGNLFNDEYK